MNAIVRQSGQEVEGISILEVNIGEYREDPRYEDVKEEAFQENMDEASLDERDCRYCMTPEALEDLVSPCGCRGSL